MKMNTILSSTENVVLPTIPANYCQCKQNEQQVQPRFATAKLIYNEYYITVQDKSKLMSDVISSKVKRKLVDNKLNLGTEFSHNLDNDENNSYYRVLVVAG